VKLLDAEISDRFPILIEIATNKSDEKRTILEQIFKGFTS
jgi:hypothetical protein